LRKRGVGDSGQDKQGRDRPREEVAHQKASELGMAGKGRGAGWFSARDDPGRPS
jgi:hypothetical protein